jgi:hypothetical protein
VKIPAMYVAGIFLLSGHRCLAVVDVSFARQSYHRRRDMACHVRLICPATPP